MKSRLDGEHRADYETEWAAMRMSRRSGRWPAGIVPPSDSMRIPLTRRVF